MSMIPDKNRSRMRLIANSVGERGARWTSTATSEPNWRNSLTKQATNLIWQKQHGDRKEVIFAEGAPVKSLPWCYATIKKNLRLGLWGNICSAPGSVCGDF